MVLYLQKFDNDIVANKAKESQNENKNSNDTDKGIVQHPPKESQNELESRQDSDNDFAPNQALESQNDSRHQKSDDGTAQHEHTEFKNNKENNDYDNCPHQASDLKSHLISIYSIHLGTKSGSSDWP